MNRQALIAKAMALAEPTSSCDPVAKEVISKLLEVIEDLENEVQELEDAMETP